MEPIRLKPEATYSEPIVRGVRLQADRPLNCLEACENNLIVRSIRLQPDTTYDFGMPTGVHRAWQVHGSHRRCAPSDLPGCQDSRTTPAASTRRRMPEWLSGNPAWQAARRPLGTWRLPGRPRPSALRPR